MCNESDLVRIFGPFAGQEVNVIEPSAVNPKDPVFRRMRAAAAKNGYTVQLRFSQASQTQEGYDPARANIYLEQGPDQKFRILPRYHIG